MITFTKEHDKVVRGFAHKAWRRAQAAGARSLQLEDVYQELIIAWCAARDKWDESRGVPFLAYLTNGMRVAINRFLARQIEVGQVECRSLDFEVEVGDAGGANTIHGIFPDENGLAGIEAFERNDARDAVMDRLTPKARLFVDLLADPPEFMLQAVRQRRARQDFARAQGLPVPPEAGRVTTSMVFDFMELGQHERHLVYAELRKIQHE